MKAKEILCLNKDKASTLGKHFSNLIGDISDDLEFKVNTNFNLPTNTKPSSLTPVL